MGASRIVVRAFGLISTLFLARLLTPADFGLIAMATSVAAGLELMTMFGFDVALLQRQTLTRDDYDSAWTLNTLMGIGLAILLVATAGSAAHYYREPRLEMVITIIAIKYILKNASNPGTIDFRRNLDFRWDFLSQVLPKLGGVILTIPLAFWLRDYRALIAGMVLTTTAGFVMSYLVHPHRPRPCLRGAGELFRFSRWLLLNSLLSFLRTNGSIFIIGRMAGTGALGAYSLATEISTLPSTELVAPINRVLGPAYVKVVHDPKLLRATFSSTFGLIALLILPTSIGLASVADPLVRVVLGDQWLATIPLIALLALAGAGNLLQTNTGSVYTALGLPRLITLTGTLHIVTLIPAILAGAAGYGILGAAWAIVLHTWLIGIGTTYLILFRTTPITLGDVLRPVWRPVLGCIVMYVVVAGYLWWLDSSGGLGSLLVAVFSATAIGVVTYGAVVLSLWRIAGRPEGSETALLRRLRAGLAWLGK